MVGMKKAGVDMMLIKINVLKFFEFGLWMVEMNESMSQGKVAKNMEKGSNGTQKS